ncbi:MAG: hypothetical protein H7Z16_19600 [Pyrinomonadaceae bacterium]|nr:hypothetical protein [Pyrinomonadaceae bacterium]
MKDNLTIKVRDEELEINDNIADYSSALVRGIVGMAPVVGPILAEVITSGIPNQKLDRVITFIKIFEDRIKYLEEDFLEGRIRGEEFGDLLEDALPQAARALSEERRVYIANLLKNSLTDEKLDHDGKKKLLSVLNALNDPEIILLYFYSIDGHGRERVFALQDRHPFIAKAISRGALSRSDVLGDVLLNSYRTALLMHNLIVEREEPLSEQITALGELLIKYIEPKANLDIDSIS